MTAAPDGSTGTEACIRDVLDRCGGLYVDALTVGSEEDLYTHGLTSHLSVEVMLELEDAFDIEFPESLIRKSTFESIRNIEGALRECGVGTVG